MELLDAIKIVNEQDITKLPIYKIWEIRAVLGNGETPQAREALKKFNDKISQANLDKASQEARVVVEKVQNVVNDIKKNNNPLQDPKIREQCDSFWNNIEIDNSNAQDPVDKEEYRKQIEELAEIETERSFIESELAHKGSILNLSAEARADTYRKQLTSILQAKGVEIIATQTFADFLAAGEKLDDTRKAQAIKTFNNLIKGPVQEKFKVSAQNAVSVLSRGVAEAEKFAKNLKVFAKIKNAGKKVAALDKKLKESYPKTYPLLKNFAMSGAVAIAFGGVGMTVYAGYRLKNTINEQRKAAMKAQKGYWEFLKQDKTQMFTLVGAVASTAISFSGLSLDNMGLISHVKDGNLSEYVSNLFGSNAAESSDTVVTLADRLRGFGKAIKANMSNSKYIARTASATLTSIAIASYEFSKLARMDPKSAEYKAQKTKAKKVLAGSALGTALGITLAGFGGAVNADHVDAVTGADTTNPQNLGPVGGKSIDWMDHRSYSTPLHEGWDHIPGHQGNVDGGVDTGVETPATPEAEAPQVETPAAPQVGDEIFHKDHGNGIVETRVLGENGMAYQQVSGLKGGIETSDSVQAFYEHRIHNMNQYNNLMKMLPNEDGNIMTVDEAVDAMLEQFDHGFVKLPEGMTPEHAIHTAFMHAHYTGDMSAIEALRCPDGKWDTVEMFEKLAPKYSTDNGFIGRPVDPDAKLIMRAGTVEMKTPCEVTKGVVIDDENNGDDIVRKENIGRDIKDIKFDDKIRRQELSPVDVIPEAPSEPTVIDNLKVSYAVEPDASVEYPAAYAGKGTYPNIDSEGYRIDPIDRGGNGLTAKEVNAPDNRLGLKLTNGDKAQLTVTDANGTATQDSRFINIRNPYEGVDSETVAKAAADLGGKPEEIIPVTDEQGKTTYQYISNEGIKMAIDPEKGSMSVTTLDGKGAPQDVQVEAANRAVEALNSSDANVRVEQMDAPAQESALTKITTKVKGNKVLQSIYARFSGGRS